MNQNNAAATEAGELNSRNPSRRRFITSSSIALAGTALSSQFPLAPLVYGQGRSPNETLGVAVIGCGSRGSGLLRSVVEQRESLNLRIPMVCDVWKPQLDEAAAFVESETGEQCATTTRYAEVLESPDVDCVMVATPDFSHTPILVDAARAQKHAYIEKPVAISLDQANQALEAVEESDIIFQAGTQFRGSAPYRGAANAMRRRVIGELLKVDCWYNRTEISWVRDHKNIRRDEVDWEQFLMDTPTRPFDSHRFRCWQLYRDYTNGLLGLLGTHLFDITAWLSGDPLPESAVGVEQHLLWIEHEHADYQECIFTYPTDFVMNFTSRHGNASPSTGSAFYGTKGTLRCPYSLSQDAEIIVTREGVADTDCEEEPVVIEPIPGTTMLENWIQCIRTGNKNTYADIHAAYAHSVTAALGIEAITSGRRIRFDHQDLQFIEG